MDVFAQSGCGETGMRIAVSVTEAIQPVSLLFYFNLFGMRTGRIVVVLSHKIYVYNFTDLKLVDHIETIKNENGSRR